jgi:hypothetical protein
MTPDYDDLPIDDVMGMPHSWGLLDPNVGTLSFVTETAIASAAATVTHGRAIPLNLSLSEIDPPLFGRAQWRHSVHATGRNEFEDVLDSYNPQCSSQWDGFRHVRARERGFYGGITDLDSAGNALSIEHVAHRGITGRGVLLDVAGWAQTQGRLLNPFAGDVIDAATLQQVADAQGVHLRPGDILCIRTGWLAAYRSLSAQERASPELSARFSGLRADDETARFLWNNRVAAVTIDNPGFEVAPGRSEDGFLHRRLLPMLGFVIGELLDFDTLAHVCAEIGRYEFQFVAVPLPIPGGLSSPSNAMAIL